MAQWKETKEPYVQVIESVKRTTQSPAAGLNLILGGVIISDAGPSTPQLISSRSEFLQTYASEELTSEYIAKIDKLFGATEKSTMASTMYLNAYRLVGSSQMLVCRATGTSGLNYIKPLSTNTSITNKMYIVKDAEVLAQAEEFTIKFSTPAPADGWLISIDGVGTLGNLVTDEGPQYDYYVVTLEALVSKLNETTKFHCCDYSYDEATKTLTLKESYIGTNIINVGDIRTKPSTGDNKGYVGLVISSDMNKPVDVDYMVINKNNTSTDISVEIRRYNHLAIISEDESGYKVDDKVYDTLPDTSKDFYQFSIKDPSMESVSKYNVGTLQSRGDITATDLNGMMEYITFLLPQDMGELGLSYTKTASGATDKIKVEAGIPTSGSKLLDVTEGAIKAAWDAIQEDERYVVEGLTDLGCTSTGIQNYIASMAQSFNAFYPISPVNSTNYMLIANHASKITMGTLPMNLYHIAPWDYDDGTVGFKYNASPTTLYWEAVTRNKRANNEFAGVLGQNNGIVSPVNLSKDFTKKERQLLLTKKVNTIFNDLSNDITYINDNWTKQEEVDVMQEENNVRLKIRISKAMPQLLKQFVGRQSNIKLWNDVYGVVDYWFNNTIKTMNYSISDVKIICDETNNTSETIRANKLIVRIMVRYYNNVKYIEVFHDAYPIGIEYEY